MLAGGLTHPSPVNAEDEPPAVPVRGQALVAIASDTQERYPDMIVTIHGVQRTKQATVLYYSVGFAGEAPDPQVAPVTAYGSGLGTYGTLQSGPADTFMDAAAAIDVPGRTSYAALRTSTGRAVAGPPPTSSTDRIRLSDRAVVQWIALAPVPAKVKIVDVLIGSAFIQHVPVGDGPLAPISDDLAPVVGTGWPRVGPAELGGGRATGAVTRLAVSVTPRPKTAPTRKPKPSATSSSRPLRSATPTPAASR